MFQITLVVVMSCIASYLRKPHAGSTLPWLSSVATPLAPLTVGSGGPDARTVLPLGYSKPLTAPQQGYHSKDGLLSKRSSRLYFWSKHCPSA